MEQRKFTCAGDIIHADKRARDRATREEPLNGCEFHKELKRKERRQKKSHKDKTHRPYEGREKCQV